MSAPFASGEPRRIHRSTIVGPLHANQRGAVGRAEDDPVARPELVGARPPAGGMDQVGDDELVSPEGIVSVMAIARSSASCCSRGRGDVHDVECSVPPPGPA